jgi:diguanylate cyclase (GGDEF)-like protein
MFSTLYQYVALSFILSFFYMTSAYSQSFDITKEHNSALGKYVTSFKDTSPSLSAREALTQYQQGHGTLQTQEYLTYGINTEPVWLILPISNNSNTAINKRVSIETSWLDSVDVYLFSKNKPVFAVNLGDGNIFSAKPINSRYLEVDIDFPPKESYLLLRVETPDPMVVPLYIRTKDNRFVALNAESFRYGIIYGAIIALMFYNLFLGLSLKSNANLFYSLYMFAFLCMNISYTGFGFSWFWSSNTEFQKWANPAFMASHIITGLLFSINFISLKHHFPKLHKAILITIVTIITTLLIAAGTGNYPLVISLAFTYMLIFTLFIILLGVIARMYKVPAANYFFSATILGAGGGLITCMTVWGLIKYNTHAYMAIEYGMVLEATLLSLALADKFNRLKLEKNLALNLANIDPLTTLNNRRALYDYSNGLVLQTNPNQDNISIIMIDIDDFKETNDLHGHEVGDEVLKGIASTLKHMTREHDFLARWGGEEFISILPNTTLDDAVIIAERYREAISQKRFNIGKKVIANSISIGVASSHFDTVNLQQLQQTIKVADEKLYRAKGSGKNTVFFNREH